MLHFVTCRQYRFTKFCNVLNTCSRCEFLSVQVQVRSRFRFRSRSGSGSGSGSGPGPVQVQVQVQVQVRFRFGFGFRFRFRFVVGFRIIFYRLLQPLCLHDLSGSTFLFVVPITQLSYNFIIASDKMEAYTSTVFLSLTIIPGLWAWLLKCT